MALPFVLGLAIGAGAVIAFNNKDKLKEKSSQLLDKSKDFANQTIERTKEICPMKKSSKENIEQENKEEV
jgi:hypothetical protein